VPRGLPTKIVHITMTKNTRDPQVDIAPIPRDIGVYKWKNPSFAVPVRPKDMDKLYNEGGASISGFLLCILQIITTAILIVFGLILYPLNYYQAIDEFMDELKNARYNQYQKKVQDVAAIKNKPKYRKKWEETLSTYGSYAATSTYWVYYNHMDEGKTWFDYYREDEKKNQKAVNTNQSEFKDKYQVPDFRAVDKVIKQKKEFAHTGDMGHGEHNTDEIRYTQFALLQMMRNELRSTGSLLYLKGELPTDKFLTKYGC
jgi:hypothetical protein